MSQSTSNHSASSPNHRIMVSANRDWSDSSVGSVLRTFEAIPKAGFGLHLAAWGIRHRADPQRGSHLLLTGFGDFGSVGGFLSTCGFSFHIVPPILVIVVVVVIALLSGAIPDALVQFWFTVLLRTGDRLRREISARSADQSTGESDRLFLGGRPSSLLGRRRVGREMTQ